MNTHSANQCPQCGQAIAPGLQGLCPNCLALVGFGGNPVGDQTVVVTPGQPPGPTPQVPLSASFNYFGDYELLEEIARGGMGVVWRARQKSLNRVVAVKMILGGRLATEADVKRFHTEAEAAANLKHPNIVAIHEIGEHEGRHYFSMDLIEGKNLAQVIGNELMSPQKAAALLKTLAEAVHYAHQRGTLHRDLKPQNVLLDTEDRPHITDFGLAKQMTGQSDLTQSGTVMGSPSYMPPEQAMGKLAEIGPASDVYSLGAILYQMLTGEAPFIGATAVDTLRQVIELEPVPPSKLNPGVPPDLETICLKCLEKKPERRYASARTLAEELERFLSHEPILAKPASSLRKAGSWTMRHPWALTGIASFAVLALLGLAFGLWERTQFLEWKAIHPSETRKTWPNPINSPLIGWLVLTPCLLSIFMVWTLKDLRREDGWRYRIHAKLLALVGSLSILSAIYLTLGGIRSLVWQRSLNWDAINREVASFMVYIAFTWAGSTLLWRLVANHFTHQRGLISSVTATRPPTKLGKLFWFVLLGEAIGFCLVYHWVVPVGQQYSQDSEGVIRIPMADLHYFLRVDFKMMTLMLVMVQLLVGLGLRRRGNGRWACFFVAAFFLMGAIQPIASLSRYMSDFPQHHAAAPNRLVPSRSVSGYTSYFPKPVVEQVNMILLWTTLIGAISSGLLIWVELIARKPSTSKTEPSPSTQFRKAFFGGSLLKLWRLFWRKKVAYVAGLAVVMFGLFLVEERLRGHWTLAAVKRDMAKRGQATEFKQLLTAPPPNFRDFTNRFFTAAKSLVGEGKLYGGGNRVEVAPGKAARGSQAAYPWDYRPGTKVSFTNGQARLESNTTNTWVLMEKWHATNEAAFAELRVLLHDPPSVSSADYLKDLQENRFPNFVSVRSVAQSLNDVAVLHLHQGDLGAAEEDLVALSGMVRMNSKDPTLVGQMIRVSIVGIGNGALWDALQADGWTEPQLERIQRAWQIEPLLPRVASALHTERLKRIEAYEILRRTSYHDWVESRRKMLGGFGMNLRKPPLIVESWRHYMFHPLWKFAWADMEEALYLKGSDFMASGVREALGNHDFKDYRFNPESESWRTPFASWRFYLMFPEDHIWSIGEITHELVWPSAVFSIPIFSKAVLTAVKNENQRQMAVTAIALKRYHLRQGHFPNQLADLVPALLPEIPVDWMSGNSLRYRLNTDGTYLLYSVGQDGRDDNGDPTKDEVWPTVVPWEK